MKTPIDLTGRSFGKLTVIKEAESKRSPGGHLNRRWLCRCDCGKEVIVQQGHLTRKTYPVTSCGCIRGVKEKKDLVGKRFGRLTVIEAVDLEEPIHDSRIGWRCKCDCGNEVITTRGSLTYGDIKSCGCLQKDRAKEFMDGAIKRYENTILTNLSSKPPKNNTSGVRGVWWDKAANLWIASITIQRKVIRLGSFRHKEDAIKARREAEEKYFKPVLEKAAAEGIIVQRKDHEDHQNGDGQEQ